MLIETRDVQLLYRIISSEIAAAEAAGTIKKGTVFAPSVGTLELCIQAGDFCFIDDKEPRIAGWYHPLSQTEVAAVHLWGPSASWKALLASVADFLLAKNFVTARWQDGNPLSSAAVPLTGGSKTPSGESSVDLAHAKSTLASASVEPLP